MNAQLAETPCTACGCYKVEHFRCNCGQAHGDVCFNCGAYRDMQHAPIEAQNQGLPMQWAGRCVAGREDHDHAHPYADNLTTA